MTQPPKTLADVLDDDTADQVEERIEESEREKSKYGHLLGDKEGEGA